MRTLARTPLALALTAVLALVAGPALSPAQAATKAKPQKKAKPKKPVVKTKWLCGPLGPKDNPCHAPLTTTVVQGTGATSTQGSGLVRNPKVDCFYVYPTVSTEPGPNADLKLTPEIRAAAQTQAARFSSRCRVYAPLYRQVTQSALLNPALNTAAARNRAYARIKLAWQEYLRDDNQGKRPVVLIGHDQGANLLVRLLKEEFDRKPANRKLLLSAMLPGGNVVVPRGKTLGGDFTTIPPCRAEEQVRCVIAYSAYDSQPPPDAYVTRLFSGAFPHRLDSTKRILCTNPSALVGGVGTLSPYFPSRALPGPLAGMLAPQPVAQPWVTYPRLYTARCKNDEGATWLQVTQTKNAADPRPRVQATLGPRWGFHLADLNLTYGQLLRLVTSETKGYPKQLAQDRRDAAELKRRQQDND